MEVTSHRTTTASSGSPNRRPRARDSCPTSRFSATRMPNRRQDAPARTGATVPVPALICCGSGRDSGLHCACFLVRNLARQRGRLQALPILFRRRAYFGGPQKPVFLRKTGELCSPRTASTASQSGCPAVSRVFAGKPRCHARFPPTTAGLSMAHGEQPPKNGGSSPMGTFWCLVFGRAGWSVQQRSGLQPTKYPALVVPSEGDSAEQELHGEGAALAAFDDGFNNVRREESKPHQPTDMRLVQLVALSNLSGVSIVPLGQAAQPRSRPRQRQDQRLVDVTLFGLGPRDDDLAARAGVVRWKGHRQNGRTSLRTVDLARGDIGLFLECDLHCLTVNHQPR